MKSGVFVLVLALAVCVSAQPNYQPFYTTMVPNIQLFFDRFGNVRDYDAGPGGNGALPVWGGACAGEQCSNGIRPSDGAGMFPI